MWTSEKELTVKWVSLIEQTLHANFLVAFDEKWLKKVRDANRDNVFTPAQIVKDKRQKK